MTRDPIGYRAGVSLVAYAMDSPTTLGDPYGLQSTVIAIPEMLAAGWTAEEIAAALGITVKAAAALIAAHQLEQAAEKLAENYLRNAKGGNPCGRALSAMAQAVKAIRSHQKFIQGHEGYIRDPSTYPGVVRNVENARRHWRHEVEVAKDNISKTRKALRNLRDVAKKACGCWYKPWHKPWTKYDPWIIAE